MIISQNRCENETLILEIANTAVFKYGTLSDLKGCKPHQMQLIIPFAACDTCIRAGGTGKMRACRDAGVPCANWLEVRDKVT